MVPDGWKQVVLKDILDGPVKNGYSPVAADTVTGYWVLSLGALGDGSLNENEIKPVIPEEKVKKALLRYGDFLVSRSNTPEKVGRSARFRGEIENCSYPDLMMKFRIDEGRANPSYIEQKLKSSPIRAYFKNCAAGSSGTMVKINKSVVEKAPLLLPGIEEQANIADTLAAWDQAIAVTEKLLENSYKQKVGLMQHLLTGKKRLLDKTGEKFVKKWSVYKLGSLFSERVETGRSDLPLLSITSESGVIYQEQSGRKNTSNDDKSKYRRICPGDIGYNTMRMWQGRSSLSDKEGVVSPAYTIITPNEFIVPQFAAYLLKLPVLVHVFYRHSQGLVSDTWNLKFKDFKSISWPIPEVDEQEKIVAVLEVADDEIDIIKKKLDGLVIEKKALMQQLLTGKRRFSL